MPVPETPVNEDCPTVSFIGQVGRTRQGRHATSGSMAQVGYELPDNYLDIRAALTYS